MRLLLVFGGWAALVGCVYMSDDQCDGYCRARGFSGGSCPSDNCFTIAADNGDNCSCLVPANAPPWLDGVQCTFATVGPNSVFAPFAPAPTLGATAAMLEKHRGPAEAPVPSSVGLDELPLAE